jgi:hypothetical protein
MNVQIFIFEVTPKINCYLMAVKVILFLSDIVEYISWMTILFCHIYFKHYNDGPAGH